MRSFRLGGAGMHGETGNGLSPDLAIDFASALGTCLEGGKVVTAIDTRFSSSMFLHSALSALMSCGSTVYDAGTAPAPLLHFLVPYLNADGGLLIGAGHHPAGWNAFVPLSNSGAYFNSVQLQELLDIYHAHNYRYCPWDKIGSLQSIPESAASAYLDMIASLVDSRLIASKKYRIIIDCCNGSGSILAAGFAERLGFELVPINDELSGILPHDPEPRPRSSFQVKSMMKALKADAGFIFNSDVSRAAVVTDSLETLSEEYTLPLVADHMLGKTPEPSTVVTNCCSTRTFDEIAIKHNANIIKTKVGQASVIDKMIESNALLAGDGSGSVACSGGVKGFDGFMTVAMILEAMASNNSSSADLAARLPRYHIIKRKVQCPSAHGYNILRGMKKIFPDAEMTEEDGFRFDWPDGWVHLRASATEPVVRMIVEWKTPEGAEDLASHVMAYMERVSIQ